MRIEFQEIPRTPRLVCEALVASVRHGQRSILQDTENQTDTDRQRQTDRQTVAMSVHASQPAGLIPALHNVAQRRPVPVNSGHGASVCTHVRDHSIPAITITIIIIININV